MKSHRSQVGSGVTQGKRRCKRTRLGAGETRLGAGGVWLDAGETWLGARGPRLGAKGPRLGERGHRPGARGPMLCVKELRLDVWRTRAR